MAFIFSYLLGWLKKVFLKKELEMSVVGLQNAGKTTLINVLSTGEYDSETMPTIGFNLRHIKKGKVGFKVWDLGGQVKFRESWQKYCRGSDVIIFIVDAADYANIDCARDELHQLLDSHSLANIPLLILGNKNDLEGALNSEEIISQMQLETITERLTASYSISAKNLTNIDIVLKWLSKLPKRKH